MTVTLQQPQVPQPQSFLPSVLTALSTVQCDFMQTTEPGITTLVFCQSFITGRVSFAGSGFFGSVSCSADIVAHESWFQVLMFFSQHC